MCCQVCALLNGIGIRRELLKPPSLSPSTTSEPGHALQSNVSYYCYTRTYGGDCGSPTCCSPATAEETQTFQSSMAQCIGAAVSAGLNVAFSPHLDDGLGYGGWRNGLLMDPTENYGGMSYLDFMLNPLADAVNSVMTENTQVDFAMQVRALSIIPSVLQPCHCQHWADLLPSAPALPATMQGLQ